MKAFVVSAGAALMLGLGVQVDPAHAQSEMPGVDELAHTITTMMGRVWKGPRTPPPSPEARPLAATQTLISTRSMVTVHAPAAMNPERLERLLADLEHAQSYLATVGWPDPISDGGLGGGVEFDLYVVPGREGAEAYADGLVSWSYLDRASTFAVIGEAVSGDSLEACVTQAYAEALLLSMDPAEARAWRKATAAWLAWVVTGLFGCGEPVVHQQGEPFRGPVSGAADEGAGGALWLAFLSARHDGGSGGFVRDLWGLASQRTWEGDGLRADPDLWSALRAVLEASGDRWVDNIEEFAVTRWFVGRWHGRGFWGAALDDDAEIVNARRVQKLPARVTSRPAIEPFGSGYVVVARPTGARDRPTDERPTVREPVTIRAWLRGEYGVQWSMIAVQLDDQGRETGRLAAPPTHERPRAYLPVVLDDATAAVLFVITNLSSRPPDADEQDVNERAFELTVDVAPP